MATLWTLTRWQSQGPPSRRRAGRRLPRSNPPGRRHRARGDPPARPADPDHRAGGAPLRGDRL